MPGPYFSSFYPEMTRIDYLIIGFWAVLVIVVASSLYILKRSLNALLEEVKQTNSVAHQLRNQSKHINEVLQEV
ncbi:hypothetical protein [Thermococcus sp.]